VGERSVDIPLPRRIFERAKERPINVVTVAGGFHVIVDPLQGQTWLEVRRRFKLSHAHTQMARELGMNPRKLGL
jgi:hypothetical protein